MKCPICGIFVAVLIEWGAGQLFATDKSGEVRKATHGAVRVRCDRRDVARCGGDGGAVCAACRSRTGAACRSGSERSRAESRSRSPDTAGPSADDH
jgi:hypothetical protein